MGILISAHRLEKSFAARTIFRSLTFAIEDGDRIGLIGPNGAGKSTLLKILAGAASSDSGDLSVNRGARVVLLEQEPTFKPGETIYECLLGSVEDPYDYDQISLVDTTISKLNLNRGDVTSETVIDSLSGGWKKRVALAQALVRKPDLLLLDEPTNHLDVAGIRWLEDFLSTERFATVTITHDRLFLQRVANKIFDLDPRYKDGLLIVRGDYLLYLETRDEIIRSQERREVVLKNTLRRETEWLRRGAKARTTKQTARIERAGDLSEEVGELSERNLKKRIQIDFQESERQPNKLVEARNLTKTVPSKDGERTLFRDLNLIITPKTRLGLLGANGCGKSTLIRCLLGREPITSGEVKLAERLDVAYFEQHRETLDPNKSLLRNIVDEGDYVQFRGAPIFARSYLDRFLFRTDQHDMPVSKLSGGEKARLRIAQMMLTAANLLVLDEPTNDLDMATLAVLEEVLTDFNGAVILVTHDRYFLDQVSNRILAFEADENGDADLIEFANYMQWEEWFARREALRKAPKSKKEAAKESASAPANNASRVSAAPSAPAPTPAPAQQKKRKLSFKEKHELDNMEENIGKAEAKLAELQAQANDPGNLSNSSKLTELYAQIAAAQAEVDRLYALWSELES